MRPEMPADILQYIADHYAPEDQGLKGIQERIASVGCSGINISPVEGKILQVLIKMAGVKKIVEVGTLCGYSAVWMARALPSDGSIITIEKEAHLVELAKQGILECDVADKIAVMHGDADAILPSLVEAGPFDMVFIDANKSGYNRVLDWAMKSVRKGGLIVADNTFLFGAVAAYNQPDGVSKKQWEEMKKFNERLGDPEKFLSVILPTSEGLSVAIKLV